MQRRTFIQVFSAGFISVYKLLSSTQNTYADTIVSNDSGNADDQLANLPVIENDIISDNISIEDEIVLSDPLSSGYDALGLPYIYGSAAGRSYFGPNPRGFDCSGLCAYVRKIGYGEYLPASTSGAWSVTRPTRDPQYGDLAFWNMSNPSPRIQHMAIYIGANAVLQSGGTKGYVNIASVFSNGTPSFRTFNT